MAQRTGAKRLIAPSAKATSARLCLALVAAGLLLSGCGGGSSEPQSTAATESSTQAGVNPSATAPGSADAGGSSQAKPGQSQSAPPSDRSAKAPPSAQGQVPGQGQKHGPTIAQPKGKREQAPAPADVSQLTVADMGLSSPSLPSGSGGPVSLTAAYTCDGKGDWPDLSWTGIPPGSAELILYVMNMTPVEGKLFVDWAVAGLDPGLTGIESGKLPKGAVVGTNGFGKRGYEICPEGPETYLFAIYALPRALSPKPGFDAREMRQQILDVSGNVGLLSVSYTRG